MEILKRGVVRRQSLTGKCPVCRCVIRLDEERDQGLIKRDSEGIALVKCPTDECCGQIVVQCGWV
jgi:hypothetical protein